MFIELWLFWLSVGLLYVGLGKRLRPPLILRVVLVGLAAGVFVLIASRAYRAPARAALSLGEVTGTHVLDAGGLVDRLELRPDCTFSRTITVDGAVLVRQSGQWGRRSADDIPTCAGKAGERLTQLMFVGFEPGCGKRLSEIELEPGVWATRPFCDDEKPALDLATVCTAAGRACVEANEYHWIRE